ncbi:hypothetical protein ACFOTA_04860 [Chitinophaga sp. GCM10012297]|uniref:Uncharacterized protein n=1 Tax=Chitinophaga chungangae TaxID=2821488 RepID=A0ABS3YBJ2_9BACT|nr:hypothetical protein [Chitinophaga chungangae]MBO9151524.1 hypothetical protein [Chitinophaga chungangae]
MSPKSNIVKIVKELDKLGYTEEFRIVGGKLYWVETSDRYDPDQIEVDHAYRFESSGTREDSSLVYGISVPKERIKGILIDVFDTLSSLEDTPVVNKVLSATTLLLTHEDSGLELKFGLLPKVHKSKFDEDPHRYVLRKGFPDFPPCPFAQSFSMLGYDHKLKQYVWLTTSILKDERLKAIDYKQGADLG